MNTYKHTRRLSLLLCAAMLFCLAACNGSIETNNPGSTASTPTAALITIGVKDGAPEVAPTDVTQAELDAAEQAYRDQVAQLKDYTGIDRLEVERVTESGDRQAREVTEDQKLAQWLSFFGNTSIKGEAAAPKKQTECLYLSFYAGETLVASVAYEGAIYTAGGRVMLTYDADDNTTLKEMGSGVFIDPR